MKYIKRSVVIDAIQWNGENSREVAEFLEGHTTEKGNVNYNQSIFIPTLEGVHEARIDDYIIKGVKGEFYPCKPDIFEMTYEKAE